MSSNRAVIYRGPYNMAIETIDYPKMEVKGKPVHHGVILQILATNICGSDMHMYRGRTDLMPGTAVGHEITGMVIEKGEDVLFLDIGDIVSVPFNVACGRCRNCKEQHTNACLSVNDLKPGGAYGYAEMGPWQGGQAEYIFIPYADFNLLRFPDREQAMEKLLDLAMITDVFPTGFHGVKSAGVGVGNTVYIAGAGPVGLCAAVSAYMLGAACVIVGDVNPDRLTHARETLGCETIDLNQHQVIRDQIETILGIPEVDCAVDAIGYEAHGHGQQANADVPSDALDTCIDVTRAGGGIGVPGVYLSIDPKTPNMSSKLGRPPLEWGRAWDKGLTFSTGQTPVMKYNRQLMTAILFGRVNLSRILGTTIITLDEAPKAYEQYNQGAAQKFVIDPHHVLSRPIELKELVTTRQNTVASTSIREETKWP
jgi:glutathione-independent formaldehyde dehydrogenase